MIVISLTLSSSSSSSVLLPSPPCFCFVLTDCTCSGGGAALVRALANTFPAYADRGVLHDGSTVWLLKKAQLSVAELQRVVGSHDVRFCFADIDQLTAIVDNGMPRSGGRGSAYVILTRFHSSGASHVGQALSTAP